MAETEQSGVVRRSGAEKSYPLDESRGASWDRFEVVFGANNHPALGPDEVLYRRYHVGRRWLGNANIWATVTNLRFGLFEESGWLFKTRRWSETSLKGVSGIDVGYGSINWIAVGLFAMIAFAGLTQGALARPSALLHVPPSVFVLVILGFFLLASYSVIAQWSRTGQLAVWFLCMLSILLWFALVSRAIFNPGDASGTILAVPWRGYALLVVGVIGVVAFLGKEFIFSIRVSGSSPALTMGYPAGGPGQDLGSRGRGLTTVQGGGNTIMFGRPGRDALPFLSQIGGILLEIRQNAEQPPSIGKEFQPSGSEATPEPKELGKVDSAIGAALDEAKHPALAGHELVHRQYQVGTRRLTNRKLWAVVTSRRVALFEERGWFSRSYRWTETSAKGVNGLDVGYSAIGWVGVVVSALLLLAGVATLSLGGATRILITSLPGEIIDGTGAILLLAGMAGLWSSLNRTFLFTVRGASSSPTVTLGSSHGLARRYRGILVCPPGPDVIPFLTQIGAVLQEVRQNPEQPPFAGPDFAPASVAGDLASTPAAPGTNNARPLKRTAERQPELAEHEILYRTYLVGWRFWGSARIWVIVTNRRLGLLERSGWLSRSYKWTEVQIKNVGGIDFSYRRKVRLLRDGLFTFTVRAESNLPTYTLGSSLLGVAGHHLSSQGSGGVQRLRAKPGQQALFFLYEIGEVLREIQQNEDITPLGARPPVYGEAGERTRPLYDEEYQRTIDFVTAHTGPEEEPAGRA
ncbi:MAG: hypothetical protein WBG19_02835 [Thermoplasmata archaeon]